MLIGNRLAVFKSCLTFRSGRNLSGPNTMVTSATTLNNFTTTGKKRNIFVNDTSQSFSRLSSFPNGYYAPYCYIQPQQYGNIATYTKLNGTISNLIKLAGGRNISTNISSLISILIANLGAVAPISSNFNGTIILNQANINAAFSMVSHFIGSISGNNPILAAIASKHANLTATITDNASMNNSPGHLSANILPYTTLSPENLAIAIMNTILADYNNPGTVGEALNNVGASGNPWSSDLTTNNTSGTFGEHVQKLLKLTHFMGLK